MKLVRTSTLVFIVAMTMAIGCRREKLKDDQVAGVWQLQGQSRDDLKTATATSLRFDSSGKLVAISLPPGFIHIEGANPDQSLSGTGTWSLVHRDGEDRVRLIFTSIERSNGRNLPYGAELFVQKSASEVRLFYFEGDPDEDRRIFFRRMSVR